MFLWVCWLECYFTCIRTVLLSNWVHLFLTRCLFIGASFPFAVLATICIVFCASLAMAKLEMLWENYCFMIVGSILVMIVGSILCQWECDYSWPVRASGKMLDVGTEWVKCLACKAEGWDSTLNSGGYTLPGLWPGGSCRTLTVCSVVYSL